MLISQHQSVIKMYLHTYIFIDIHWQASEILNRVLNLSAGKLYSMNDLRIRFSKVSFFWTESFQWLGRTDSQSEDHSAVFRNNMGNYRYYS